MPADPDIPAGAGLPARLQTALGRLAVRVSLRLKPPITLGVRLVALDAGGRVLLVRHSYMPGWALPGGGVEAGETAREAVVREAREEAGLVLAEPPTLVHLYLNRKLADRDHVALFVARGVRQPAPPARSAEILATAFFPPDALPPDATPATRARLSEVLDGVSPPDTW